MKFFQKVMFFSFLTIALIQSAPITFIAPGQIGAKEFVITKPGLYVVSDDIVQVKAQVAVTIATGNVVLDLNGKTVGGSQESSAAIVITSGAENVTVMNGKITGFTDSGIRVAGANNVIFKDLVITGMLFADETHGIPSAAETYGIKIVGATTSGSRTAHVKVDSCAISNWGVGLSVSEVNDVSVRDSRFVQNKTGIDGSHSRLWDITQCNCSEQRGIQVAGANFSGCESVRIHNTIFSSNHATTGNGRGCFVQEGSSDFEITGCVFNNNGGTQSGRGLEVIASNLCVIKDCTFNGNFSTASSARGLSLSGFGHSVENCKSDANWTSGMGGFGATGILVADGAAITIAGCHVGANASVATDRLGTGNGILVQPSSERCFIKNCTAVSNATAGFRDNAIAATTNLWIGNLSWGHGENNYIGKGLGFIPFTVGMQPKTGTFDERGMDNISVV